MAECGELWRGVAECGEVWQVVRGGKVCIVYFSKNEKNRSVVCMYRQVGTYQQLPTGTKRSVNGFHRVLQWAHDDRLSKKRIPWYYPFFVLVEPFFQTLYHFMRRTNSGGQKKVPGCPRTVLHMMSPLLLALLL